MLKESSANLARMREDAARDREQADKDNARIDEMRGELNGLITTTDWRAAPRTRPPSVIPLEPPGPGDCEAPSAVQGPKGDKGDKGDPGEVDYARVQDMITAVVSASMQQIAPQIEDSLLAKMAADDRFRGRDGTNGAPGADGKSPEIDYGKLAAEVVKQLPPITFQLRGTDGKITDTERVPLGGTLTIDHRQISR